jgi:hypothetical protein
VVGPLVALVALAAAGTTTYTGESDQGYPVRAVVHDGTIDRIRVRWAAPCDARGYVWGPQATLWFNRQPAPFTVAGERYSDHGRNAVSFSGSRAVMSQRLSGRFVDDAFITGVQSSTVRVFAPHGKKLLGSCSSTVRFRLAPAAPMQAPQLRRR